MTTTATAGEGEGGPDGRRPSDERLEILDMRVSAIEGALLAMASEVRTGRLVVTDASGTGRLVGEVVAGTAELRVDVGRATSRDRPTDRASVVLHAGVDGGLGALMGLQLWAQGDAIVELDAWPDSDGRWRPRLHLGTPS